MKMDDSIKIIENGYVFTGDRQNRTGLLPILIQGGRIVDIGKPVQVFKAQYPAAEVIDANGKILLPGFVDAHYAGESFILRYLTYGQPMSRWTKIPRIRRAMEYIQREASAEEFLTLYRLSYFAALKAGVTTLAEFGIDNPEHSFAAAHEAMQQVNLRGFIGLHNGDQMEAAQQLRDTPIRFAVVIADEDELTTYNLQAAIRVAREREWPLMLHLGQTRRAFDIVKKNFNKSIAQLYAEYRVLDSPAHMIHLACYEEGDIDILSKSNVPLVVSPSAILQKGVDVPPFEELIRRKIVLALGADWGAAQPLENIQSYSSILRTLGLATDKASDLVALHTRNGARALRLDSEIGSLEVGKRADVAFLRATDFRLHPMYAADNADRILEVVLQEMSSNHVSDVMINGEFYVREGHILTYSEEDLAREGAELLDKLLRLAGGSAPASSSPAPVLKLAVQGKKEEAMPSGDMAFEEGFRIVGKENQQPAPRVAPDNSKEETTQDAPRNIRKIFGDDEV
jgi:5-methylthioadenosine/S-adenosylhomocysteine deaminase